MTDKLRTALTVLAFLASAAVWLSYCHDPQVRATEKLREQTHSTDSSSHHTDARVSRLAADSFQREAQLARLDTRLREARGEIAVLKTRMIVPTLRTPPDTLVQQVAIRDSVIDQLILARDAADSQVTIWQALAQERGELLSQALGERDAYRAIIAQQKPKRFACIAGVGASIGWGQGSGITVACGLRI